MPASFSKQPMQAEEELVLSLFFCLHCASRTTCRKQEGQALQQQSQAVQQRAMEAIAASARIAQRYPGLDPPGSPGAAAPPGALGGMRMPPGVGLGSSISGGGYASPVGVGMGRAGAGAAGFRRRSRSVSPSALDPYARTAFGAPPMPAR